MSLFIIGCGLVVLETAANPYVTELGDRSTAASRLNLAQSFNGLGCILAPLIMGQILFTGDEGINVALPYSVMGVVVLIVALIFSRVKLPEITDGPSAGDYDAQSTGTVISKLLHNKRFVFGVSALFCYEISEISINSFFINYVTDGGWMTSKTAAVVLSFGGLGLFMAARVTGSWIMSRIAAEKVLCFCAIMTVIASLIVTLDIGLMSRISLFACYAFEAIMFPTIFAISIRGLAGSSTKIASSFLMMSPLGGAVGTLLMGLMADVTSMSTAFLCTLRRLYIRPLVLLDRHAKEATLTISSTSRSVPLNGPEAPSLIVHIAAAKVPASIYDAPLLRIYRYPVIYVSPHPVASTTSSGSKAGIS